MTVGFSEATLATTKRRMLYLKEHEKELGPATITVLLRKEEDFLSSALRPGSEIVWYSDEPRDRGGQDRGPSPLSYFLSSMGFCQLVHYAEHCMVDNLSLDSLEIKIEGKISMQRPRRFTEVAYEAVIHSSLSDDVIRRLARVAADDCYVTNTLKNACRVTGIITHNETRIDEHR